jgi:benzoyl-CoA reductase subunit A
MRAVIGIDLGSTTTKAVVMDEAGRLIGRGITNTRSNYDVACGVAKSEALVAAHFSLFKDALAGRVARGPELEELAREIERCFRLEQHLHQLDELRRELRGVADAGGWHSHGRALGDRAVALCDRVIAEAPAAFASGAPRGSEFFRDLVGARWRVLAEDRTESGALGFDCLMGCFDKAIVRVENRALDLSFARFARIAVDRYVRERTASEELESLAHALRNAAGVAAAATIDERGVVGTGYGRSKLPFRKEQIRSEILCHGLGAHHFFPGTRTVLDIGGQDTKAIQVDPQGIVTGFQMNDRCAAGCGRYLGYIADEMNVAVQELGPMAQKATRSIKINSTCTVFAGAELRDRLALGQKREDVVAGLHRAIVLRAMSLLARSGGVSDEFTFTGGVARNAAAVAALAQLVKENYGERTLNISPDSIYTGAVGAALFALRAVPAEAVPC